MANFERAVSRVCGREAFAFLTPVNTVFTNVLHALQEDPLIPMYIKRRALEQARNSLCPSFHTMPEPVPWLGLFLCDVVGLVTDVAADLSADVQNTGVFCKSRAILKS